MCPPTREVRARTTSPARTPERFASAGMSLEVSFKDILLGTPTRSSSTSRTSSSAAEAAVSTESGSKGGSPRPVACPTESTLTPAVVATPTHLAQAPAEVPFGEELPLTLQAYPHLRNTPAAKGWCRRLSCAPRPRGATPLYTPCAPLTPVRPPNGLEARGTAHRPRPRREPTVAAHPLHGQWWLAGMLVSPASPVEGACSGVISGWSSPSARSPTDPASSVPLAGIAATATPEKPQEGARALLTMEKPHDPTPRAVARCTQRPGRAARRRRWRTLVDRFLSPQRGAAAARPLDTSRAEPEARRMLASLPRGHLRPSATVCDEPERLQQASARPRAAWHVTWHIAAGSWQRGKQWQVNSRSLARYCTPCADCGTP